MAENEEVALAIEGGPRVRSGPFPALPHRFGEEEFAQVREALEQQTLFYWHGRKCKDFCRAYARLYGVPYCHMVSSGTAALHCATAAVGIGPGDEVITTPMTDQGTVIAILAQGGVPIFADLDPHTYNLTADTIRERLTERTRAVIVVHLAGNPADLDPILELCREAEIPLIEDCAQAYMARYKGRLVGTLGDLGCFSLNDFKHISAGDGGMVLTRNDTYAERVRFFLDKGYDRLGMVRRPTGFAMNYRPTELQGAVALAQLKRLPWICESRRQMGDLLSRQLEGIPGIHPHHVDPSSECSYWFYMGRIDPTAFSVSRDEFLQAVAAEGVPVTPGYIGRLVYENPLFQDREAFPGKPYPWDGVYGRSDIRYDPGLCPVAEEIESTAWRCLVHEGWTVREVNDVAAAFRKVAARFTTNPQPTN